MKKRLVVVMSEVGRDGSVYKRTTPGILVVMKMFYILTISNPRGDIILEFCTILPLGETR